MPNWTRRGILVVLAVALGMVLVSAPVAAAGNWKVLCDQNTKEISISEHEPGPGLRVIQGGFDTQKAALAWVDANYPSWRCE